VNNSDCERNDSDNHWQPQNQPATVFICDDYFFVDMGEYWKKSIFQDQIIMIMYFSLIT